MCVKNRKHKRSKYVKKYVLRSKAKKKAVSMLYEHTYYYHFWRSFLYLGFTCIEIIASIHWPIVVPLSLIWQQLFHLAKVLA